MAITEGPGVDQRTADVRAYIEYVKDGPGQEVYVQRLEEQQAKEARRAHMREIAKKPRKGQKRPWQTLGITAAEWRQRLVAVAPEQPLPPSKREQAEARKRHKRR